MADDHALTKYMVNGHSAFSPLNPVSMPNPEGGPAGLSIAERAHLGKLSLRGDGEVMAKIGQAAGCGAPTENLSFMRKGERLMAAVGPDEAILLVEAGAEASLAAVLENAISGHHGAVVDVTDALCALHLTGDKVRWVLAKGCALDLHSDIFVAGMCAQTMLSHAGVTLICEGVDDFILICRTSFASYVLDWLCDAATDVGVEVA